MNKKGKEQGWILTLIVGVIVGVIMLGVVFNMITDRVTTYSATQNLINYTTADTKVLLTNPHADFQEVTGTIYIKNNTEGADLTTVCNISVDRYLLCSEAHTLTPNLINVSYSYVKGGYYTTSLVRTIVPIIYLLLAVGILVLITMFGQGKGKK